MRHFRDFGRMANLLLGIGLILVITASVVLSLALYRGDLRDTVPVTVYADRTGLMLERGCDVKLNGVVVGRVESVVAERDRARINISIDSDRVDDIPSNVSAAIDPTTLLGRKFITLERPQFPERSRLIGGSVIDFTQNSTEVNDLLKSLVQVVDEVDPRKVSDTLNALALAVNGAGDETGRLIDQLNTYLGTFNPYLPLLRRDIRIGTPAVQTLADAAPDLLTTVRNLTTTAHTLTDKQQQFAAFLLSFSNLGNTGRDLFVAGGRPLQESVASLNPTLAVLGQFSGILPCFLNNLAQTSRTLELTNGGSALPGLNVVGTILAGNPPYTYPENLPKVGLSGVGPSCYEPRGGRVGHVDFPDGSDAYRPINDAGDLIGNPLATLLFGGH